jgi:hypothetical protein
LKKEVVVLMVSSACNYVAVVYFSGFSDANKQFSIEFKNQLAKMVTDLGGEVRFDNEFNEHITHVVRPSPSFSPQFVSFCPSLRRT